MTPHVYLNLLRMELAVKSVMHGQDSLSAVSNNLGSASQGILPVFSRSCRRQPERVPPCRPYGSPVGA